MASFKKSIVAAHRISASVLILGTCLVLSEPALAGRDAGQMIAQDKANKDVIARRKAAHEAASSASAASNPPEALPIDHGPRAATMP